MRSILASSLKASCNMSIGRIRLIEGNRSEPKSETSIMSIYAAKSRVSHIAFGARRMGAKGYQSWEHHLNHATQASFELQSKRLWQD